MPSISLLPLLFYCFLLFNTAHGQNYLYQAPQYSYEGLFPSYVPSPKTTTEPMTTTTTTEEPATTTTTTTEAPTTTTTEAPITTTTEPWTPPPTEPSTAEPSYSAVPPHTDSYVVQTLETNGPKPIHTLPPMPNGGYGGYMPLSGNNGPIGGGYAPGFGGPPGEPPNAETPPPPPRPETRPNEPVPPVETGYVISTALPPQNSYAQPPPDNHQPTGGDQGGYGGGHNGGPSPGGTGDPGGQTGGSYGNPQEGEYGKPVSQPEPTTVGAPVETKAPEQPVPSEPKGYPASEPTDSGSPPSPSKYLFPSMIGYGSVKGGPPPFLQKPVKNNNPDGSSNGNGYGFGYGEPPSPRTQPPPPEPEVPASPEPAVQTSSQIPGGYGDGYGGGDTTNPNPPPPTPKKPCTGRPKPPPEAQTPGQSATDGPPVTPKKPCTKNHGQTTTPHVDPEPTPDPSQPQVTPKKPCTGKHKNGNGNHGNGNNGNVGGYGGSGSDGGPSYGDGYGSSGGPQEKPAGGAGCEDKFDKCPDWAHHGECDSNPFWMKPNCQKSCNTCGITITDINKPAPKNENCKNNHELCEFWKANGECKQNEPYMTKNCPLSCGVC